MWHIIWENQANVTKPHVTFNIITTLSQILTNVFVMNIYLALKKSIKNCHHQRNILTIKHNSKLNIVWTKSKGDMFAWMHCCCKIKG